MSVLVSHPTGNPNVRAFLRAVTQSDQMHSFWTTLSVGTGSGAILSRLGGLRELAERRAFPEVDQQCVRAKPLFELGRQIALKAGLSHLVEHETGTFSVDAVYRRLDRQVSRHLETDAPGAPSKVYCYDDGALETFKAARDKGIATYLELPIVHYQTMRDILAVEAELVPDWSGTLHGRADSDGKLRRKDQELALADHVVVPSTFVKTSVAGRISGKSKLHVAPYGGPAPYRDQPNERRKEEPLRILFAGQVCQRKGISYLLEALLSSDIHWHLTIAGKVHAAAPEDFLKLESDPRVDILGQIPHADLLSVMAKSHVFVLPTLAEGMPLVTLEALAAGLPIISTANGAADDLIDNGVDGFNIPIRNSEIIAEKLALMDVDEPLRQSMSAAALRRAEQSTWKRFEDRIRDIISIAS